MDQNKEAKPTMDSYITPLVVSTAGIIFSTLAIAVYHCILLRYVANHQRATQNNNDINNINISNRRRFKGGGVQEEILDKIPIFSISSQKSHIDVLHNECSICLGLFEDSDEVRLLPDCKHFFHRPCIDLWLIDHDNCPFCRSPITCDWELELPSASDQQQQQRVSNVPMNINMLPSSDHHHHNQLSNYDDMSGSTSRFQRPRPVLLHSFSLSSHVRPKPRALIMGLKRSLSLDLTSSSYIAITIQRDDEGRGFTSSASSSSSNSNASSSKRVVMSEYYYRSRSLRHVDVMSSGLMRSFSQFRNSASGRYNSILPH